MPRFLIQYQPTSGTRYRTVRAGSWDAAAHTAVDLARSATRQVTILRFDPDTGWSIAGLVRDMEGTIRNQAGDRIEPHVYLLQDLRGPAQVDADIAVERAASARRATLEVGRPVGWRSAMRVLAAGRPFQKA